MMEETKRPAIAIARGALACEAALVRDIEALVAPAMRDPRLLAVPVRLVVPSHSLREHMGARLVSHFGRSIAGVSLHTLHGLAVEILERAGLPLPVGGALFPVIVRQQAREQDRLHRDLDELADGYASVVGSVADLIDAGFEPAHGEALDELLDHAPAARGQIERARALVTVAERTMAVMATARVGHVSTALRQAREMLDRGGVAALPARAVLIHGFADATGVATDLIEALVRHCAARIYIDHPTDPAAAADSAAGVAFTRRFSDRLGSAAPVAGAAGSSHGIPRLVFLRAPGAHAEVRAVAERLRALLQAGTRPESVGVVARDLSLYAVPLRVHLGRLGIPCSAVGVMGPLTPVGRRARALLDVMHRRADAPVDRWLDALATLAGSAAGAARPPWRADLRLALHALGAARLKDVAGLVVSSVVTSGGDYPLPSRQGLWSVEADDEGSVPRASRRRLPGWVLHRVHEAARQLCTHFAQWPARADLGAHSARLDVLLREHLGWTDDLPGYEALVAAARDLPSELPRAFPLSRDDFALLLERTLADLSRDPLGGNGGGVQLLDVTSARSRTFDHLFLLGMNRDVFPRLVLEDPLLPDDLRAFMTTVLPDLPIKRTGFDEERYLFAQLLSASPTVTLSWQIVGDDGNARPPSPLVERLRLARPEVEVEQVASLYAHPRESPHAAPEGRETSSHPRPAHEHAVLAGLFDSRARFARLLPIALGESQRALPIPGLDLTPAALARARLAVLAEVEPDRRTAEGWASSRQLGPYHGFVGRVREHADPRRAPLYITAVEDGAACAWQLFVRRLLRIAPTPDALGALPAVDPLLLGSAVHRVLERIVAAALVEPPADLAQARHRPPTPVPWPDGARVECLLREEALVLIRDQGIALPGLVEVLARVARPYLEVARRLDWQDGPPAVISAEITGNVTLNDGEGNPRTIHFKADRVDAADGGLRITDYKTGKAISESAAEATRIKHYRRRIARGESLQAMAYALGAGGAHDVGRYLHVKPDIGEDGREVVDAAKDPDARAAFVNAVRAILSAWDLGTFFPRFVEPDGRTDFARCQYCEVAEACLRSDSGYRARFLRWVNEHADAGNAGGTLRPEARALLRLWNLRRDGAARGISTASG